MFGPAKIGFSIAIAVIILGLFSPLITLGLDIASKNNPLGYTIKVIEEVNKTHDRVNITVFYKGRVPLTGFTLKLGKTAIYFGRIRAGNNTRTIIIPKSDLQSNNVGISFKVVFYKIKIVETVSRRE